jgi:hypothetical protein
VSKFRLLASLIGLETEESSWRLLKRLFLGEHNEPMSVRAEHVDNLKFRPCISER